jgi:alanine racemase
VRAAILDIDTKALQHNFQLLRDKAGKSRVLAVIKADAYGHGLARVASTFDADTWFGVACFDEAVALRRGGISNPILVLEGFFDQEELLALADWDLKTVVHHQYQVDLILENRLSKPLDVWLKIDTGMHRLGLLETEFYAAYQKLNNSAKIQQPINLMSHFACADEPENEMTQQQLQRFINWTKDLPGEKSLANSAGFLNFEQTYFDMVRPGLLLYGSGPNTDQEGHSLGLKPVMRLRSNVIAIKTIEPGQTVGYGAAWSASQQTKIAIVAIGYGDGYPRHAKNGTPVWIAGKVYPLAGRVSMDLISVDIGLHNDVNIGSEAVLWGTELPVEQVAEHADTISYELMCGITPRVPINVT